MNKRKHVIASFFPSAKTKNVTNNRRISFYKEKIFFKDILALLHGTVGDVVNIYCTYTICSNVLLSLIFFLRFEAMIKGDGTVYCIQCTSEKILF